MRVACTHAHENIGMPTAIGATNSTNSENCSQRFSEIRANSWLVFAFELCFRKRHPGMDPIGANIARLPPIPAEGVPVRQQDIGEELASRKSSPYSIR